MSSQDEKKIVGTSLVVQWLKFRIPSAAGRGSHPWWGAKILHKARCSQKKNWGLSWAELCPPNSYTEALTPSTSGCGCI